MSPPQIFLETSIQIERFMYREREPIILHNLYGRRIHTSCYVFSEFRRTLLKDIDFIHSVVWDKWASKGIHRMHLPELLDYLSKEKQIRSNRRLRRFLWIAAGLVECFGSDPVPTSDVLIWLDEHIEAFAKAFFLVEFFEPGMRAQLVQSHCLYDCDLAKDDHNLTDGMRCRRDDATCVLPEFLESNRPQLLEILAAMKDAPSDRRDDRAIRVLEVLLADKDFQRAKGQRNCWPLGDTIIALEAPQGAQIYTLDRHFDVICQALGKRRYEEDTESFP